MRQSEDSPGVPSQHSRIGWRGALDGAAAAAMIVASAALIWTIFRMPPQQRELSPRPQQIALPSSPVSIDGAETKGNQRAPVTIIEYSEFECPYCRMFAEAPLPEIMTKFVATGQVQFAFRHFPLERIHRNALSAAEAAACAGRQGRFWELHDRLFSSTLLSPQKFREYAVAAALDGVAFEACLKGQAIAQIRRDIESGQALGVTSTPTFFIGLTQEDGKVRLLQKLSGTQSFGAFSAAIDGAIRVGQK